MTNLEPNSWIKNLDVYVGGKSKAAKDVPAIKLSSNESALGPSPMAMEAYAAESLKLHRYPDASYTLLREKLAEKYDLEADRIICGMGSDEILKMVCRAYVQPGEEVIYSRHGFMMYPIAAKGVGGIPVEAPDVDYTAHVDSILDCITDRTRVIFLANPNNPTGTFLDRKEVQRLWENMPGNVLLVLDAAYAEFVENANYDAGLELINTADNVLMTRTFSKLYGLAALRVGWGYACKEVSETLDRTRDPFNVSSAAQVAAVAALEDEAFEEKAVAHNSKWRAWLETEITKLGLTAVPTQANFVLIHFPDAGKTAEAANEFLLSKGYILRWLPKQGLPDCLRLSVGLEEENRAVIRLLQEFLEQ